MTAPAIHPSMPSPLEKKKMSKFAAALSDSCKQESVMTSIEPNDDPATLIHNDSCKKRKTFQRSPAPSPPSFKERVKHDQERQCSTDES